MTSRPEDSAEQAARVADVLEESQRLGFLGERVITEVVEHARQFVAGLEGITGTVADIGAGGGVPGLVVALDRPDLTLVLIDRRAKRTDYLRRVVRRLGWSDRITVVESDVNDVPVDGDGFEGGGFDAVVARGFGPPDVTVQAAARLVRVGGVIVISEPPTGDRWNPEVLDALSLTRVTGAPRGVVVFRRNNEAVEA